MAMQGEETNETKDAKATREFTVNDRYLNKREVAALLGVSLRTVDNLMRGGWLVYRKIGRTVRFLKSEVDQHLARKCRMCGPVGKS